MKNVKWKRPVIATYRKYWRDPTNRTKLRTFQHRRAIKQRVFRKARKDTWNKFVNSLNSRTPTKKVWEKFRKVNRNYKPRTVPPLNRWGKIITLPDEIEYTFADHYANILKDLHKKSKPGKNRNKKREEKLPYKPFTDRTESSHIPSKRTQHQVIKKNYRQRH